MTVGLGSQTLDVMTLSATNGDSAWYGRTVAISPAQMGLMGSGSSMQFYVTFVYSQSQSYNVGILELDNVAIIANVTSFC